MNDRKKSSTVTKMPTAPSAPPFRAMTEKHKEQLKTVADELMREQAKLGEIDFEMAMLETRRHQQRKQVELATNRRNTKVLNIADVMDIDLTKEDWSIDWQGYRFVRGRMPGTMPIIGSMVQMQQLAAQPPAPTPAPNGANGAAAPSETPPQT